MSIANFLNHEAMLSLMHSNAAILFVFLPDFLFRVWFRARFPSHRFSLAAPQYQRLITYDQIIHSIQNRQQQHQTAHLLYALTFHRSGNESKWKEQRINRKRNKSQNSIPTVGTRYPIYIVSTQYSYSYMYYKIKFFGLLYLLNYSADKRANKSREWMKRNWRKSDKNCIEHAIYVYNQNRILSSVCTRGLSHSAGKSSGWFRVGCLLNRKLILGAYIRHSFGGIK